MYCHQKFILFDMWAVFQYDIRKEIVEQIPSWQKTLLEYLQISIPQIQGLVFKSIGNKLKFLESFVGIHFLNPLTDLIIGFIFFI